MQWLTPFTDIRSAQETTGGSSDVEFMRINQFYMQTSQNMAKYQGLKTAGKDIELKYLGVYVLTSERIIRPLKGFLTSLIRSQQSMIRPLIVPKI